MLKRFKKYISILLTVIITITVLPSSANADEGSYKPNTVDAIQESIDSVGYAATATKVDVDESAYIWSLINSKLITIGFYEELNANGYIEKSDIKADPVKIIDDRYTDLTVYYYMTIYENDLGNLVAAMFVYDVNTNSLLKVEANAITDEGSFEGFFSYSEYNKPMARDFNVWGVNFLCATTGLIACTAYCAMIGVLNVGVGLTCSIVCGTAFNLACS